MATDLQAVWLCEKMDRGIHPYDYEPDYLESEQMNNNLNDDNRDVPKDFIEGNYSMDYLGNRGKPFDGLVQMSKMPKHGHWCRVSMLYWIGQSKQ